VLGGSPQIGLVRPAGKPYMRQKMVQKRNALTARNKCRAWLVLQLGCKLGVLGRGRFDSFTAHL